MFEQDAKGHGGSECHNWREAYEMVEESILPQLRRFSTPVLLDCSRCTMSAEDETSQCKDSAGQALASCYLHCLYHGIRLAVSNSATLNIFAREMRSFPRRSMKGPLQVGVSSPILLLQQRRSLLRYDSATAAGLPLLQTIRDQLQAGRRVSTVQGTFSATVGFILDRISRDGKTLRQASEEAYAMGICEPVITADLVGGDTIEKLRVVAFALGCELPEDRVELKPVVAVDALQKHGLDLNGGTPSPEDIFEALDAFDRAEAFSESAARDYQNGKRWRFVATLQLHTRGQSPGLRPTEPGLERAGIACATIGLEKVDEKHFAYPNIWQEVSFALWEDPISSAETPKHHSAPLVLRGLGAGKAAGEGALADVIRLVGLS
eukprot:TRINITY_DN3865_c0_g1_i1.p1 TRINITY_DN3865_c0_g1~~TRINITY_DN3865_c0_g1_i1.p1  ORF type:complete len:420 (+),score=68.07 TRINITY_DN3865_c0_g1_i1:128-1261(+)